MPKQYIIRGLNDLESDAFVDAGERAKAEGRGLRAVIIRLVELYAKVGLPPLERAAKDLEQKRQ